MTLGDDHSLGGDGFVAVVFANFTVAGVVVAIAVVVVAVAAVVAFTVVAVAFPVVAVEGVFADIGVLVFVSRKAVDIVVCFETVVAPTLTVDVASGISLFFV